MPHTLPRSDPPTVNPLNLESRARPIRILLVEDNPGDVSLTREALEEVGVSFELAHAKNGEVALDMLFRKNGHESAPRPDIVLLDLNLPRVTGHEVLAKMKSDPGLRRIPVNILTTSRAEDDIHRCYDLHANAYLCKPTGIDEFLDLVRSIMVHWGRVAEVPQK